MRKSSQHHSHYLLFGAFITLLFIVVGLYAPTIHFGLIWDDPEWYSRVINQSFFDLIQPYPDYQFYRPGLMVFNRLFVTKDNTLAIHLLHWAQICWYVLNLPLIFGISRQLGFTRWAAFMVAILTAFHPFTFQAVSWAAPGQPLATFLLNAALFLYLLDRKKRNANAPFSHLEIFICGFILFILAMSVHETTVVFAVMPILFEIILRLRQSNGQAIIKSWQHPWRNGWGKPALFLLAGVLFFSIWLFTPKESGITGLFWDPRVFTYLLQGFILPFADSQFSSLIAHDGALMVIWIILIILLWGISVYRKRGQLATLGLIWAFLGIAPVLISLSYDYVSIAARLFYSATPGVAWLWVTALWPTEENQRSLTAVFGIILLNFIALFGLITTHSFKQLYTPGITHLNDLVTTLDNQDGAYLFINFPDRYRLKNEPLATGYWGITLAPVVVDLAEFPALLNGSRAQTTSFSMPWLDEVARSNGPYQVDMRGVIIQPEELYQQAKEKEAVFVTRYDQYGSFHLNYAGALATQNDAVCETAVFENILCLDTIQLMPNEDQLIVQTAWWTSEPLPPHLSLFIHLGQQGTPPIAQADGDSWQGTLPLANWQVGDLIIDQRRLPLPDNPDNLQISIGVYNWVSGERLTGIDKENQILPENAVIISLPPFAN